jgi:hypothetical protein
VQDGFARSLSRTDRDALARALAALG